MGHTPGPWKWEHDALTGEITGLQGPDGEEIICPRFWAEPDGSHCELRVGGHNAVDGDLIKAAPDLLEACRTLIQGGECDCHKRADILKGRPCEICQGRAAIAKATPEKG